MYLLMDNIEPTDHVKIILNDFKAEWTIFQTDLWEHLDKCVS